MRRRLKKPKRVIKKSVELQEVLGLSQETKNGIWGVASLGLAVVSVLAFFGRAGQAGELFSSAAKSLFGWGIFLVPMGLALLGVAFLKSISRKIYTSAIIGTALFVFGFLAVFHILGNGDLAMRLHQGGYLGLIIGLPILKAVGFTSSFVILVILLFVSVLIALNIPVHKLILRKEEDAEGDEEMPVLKDNVVIKRGMQVITPAMQKAEELQRANQKPETRNWKPEIRIGDEDREFVIKASRSGKWVLPPIEILNSDKDQPRSGDINANVTIIKRTLSNFGIDVEMGEVSIGPAVTQFTLRPAVGVKIAKITTL